jgi:hypothetical protein
MINFAVSMDEDRQPGPSVRIVAQYAPSFPGFVPAFMRPTDHDGGEEAADAAAAPASASALEDELQRTDSSDWAPGVEIVVEHTIAGFSGLPFAYEIVTPAQPDGQPRGHPLISSALIRIVAAPGVRITFLPAGERSPIVRIDVARVQDPHCIPALGEPVDMSLLLASNGVPMHRNSLTWFRSLPGAELARMYQAVPRAEGAAPETDPELQLRAVIGNTRVVVLPQRNGMLFFDNRTSRMLQVQVPVATRHGAAESPNGALRFSWWYWPSAPLGERAVVVAATAGVTVREFYLSEPERIASAAPPEDSPLQGVSRLRPFALYRIDSFDWVPLPGTALPAAASPGLHVPQEQFLEPRRMYGERIEEVDIPPGLRTMLARMGTDVAFGVIPVVGDAIDLLELAWAAMSGRDRWGQRVGPLDMALMALGSALPFVSNTAMRRAGTAILFGGIAGATAAGLVPAEEDDEDVE